MSALLFLAAAEPVASSIPETFGLDVKAILLQVLFFAIFASILWYGLLRPISATLEQRQKTIADGLQYAEEMKHRLADAERQQAETLRNAQIEAGKILEQARASAKALSDRAAQEAAARAEELLRKGRESLELEREKTLAEVRREVARLVVETTGRVLRTELTDAERRRYNEAAARELSLN